MYERNKETGKKILMSGGARCNVLPVSARVEDCVTESTPRLIKNVLASWNVERCREWLEDEIQIELGIEHVTNKYFPLSNSLREVRDKLLRACGDCGCGVRYGASVESLRATPATEVGPFDSPAHPRSASGGGFSHGWAQFSRRGNRRNRIRHRASGPESRPSRALSGVGAAHRRPPGRRARFPGLSVDVSLVCDDALTGGEGAVRKGEEESKGESRGLPVHPPRVLWPVCS